MYNLNDDQVLLLLTTDWLADTHVGHGAGYEFVLHLGAFNNIVKNFLNFYVCVCVCQSVCVCILYGRKIVEFACVCNLKCTKNFACGGPCYC